MIAVSKGELRSFGWDVSWLLFSDTADDKYHIITVKVTDKPNITLRHRTGYLHSKEPTTLKERFRQAIWQPADVGEIGVTARPETDSKGNQLKLNIEAADCAQSRFTLE